MGLEVEETEPELSVMRETIDSMRHAGVKVREGGSERESEEGGREGGSVRERGGREGGSERE